MDYETLCPREMGLSRLKERMSYDECLCTCPKKDISTSDRNLYGSRKLETNGIPIPNHKALRLRVVNLKRILGSPDCEDTKKDILSMENDTGIDEKKFWNSKSVATRSYFTNRSTSMIETPWSSRDVLADYREASTDRWKLKKKPLSSFEKNNLKFLRELKSRQKQLLRDNIDNSLIKEEISTNFSEIKQKTVLHPETKKFVDILQSPLRKSKNISRSKSLEETEVGRKKFSRMLLQEAPWSFPTNYSFNKFSINQDNIEEEEDFSDDIDVLGTTPPLMSSSCDHSYNTWWACSSLSPTSTSITSKSPSRVRSPMGQPMESSYDKNHFSSVQTDPTRSFLARQSFSRRSFSTPVNSLKNQIDFVPLDLSLSFTSTFEGRKKCRAGQEGTTAQLRSILYSSDEDCSEKNFYLPTTPECFLEESSDEEDTPSKKPAHEPSKLYPTTPPDLGSKPPFPDASAAVSSTKKLLPKNLSISQQTQSKNDSQLSPSGNTQGATKKLGPMAFTVELGDSAASDSSGSGSVGKKLDISASITQWVPKHRRNLSLSKVEENKKVEEKQSSGPEKPPIGRPRSGTVGAASLGLKRGGYHSEGYFSSDQDEDSPKRTELKSPRSPRGQQLENLKSSLAKSPIQDSPKGTSVRMRPPSPASSPYGVPLNESASYLIERIMNTPETKRKHASKPEGRACCKERERKPSVSELTGKSYKIDKSKMGTDSKKQARNTPTEDLDLLRDEKDDVSEAGTYTIDKDSPSPEVEQARSDIDIVFGLESEAEVMSSTAVPMSTTDQCHEDESSWMSASEVAPAISRNSPNWIHQWAAQVAEQTKSPVEAISPQCKTILPSSRGHKLPLSSQESPECRPRRKLPAVPSHLPSNHQRPIDTSDSETIKSRLWRDSTLSTDLTSDAERFTRDTENVMTSSLQARVIKPKVNPAFRNSSFESHESGGESDIDTSTSYAFNDDERLSVSLRNKLKLTGLHPPPKNNHHSPSAHLLTNSRRTDPVKDTRVLNREATYDIFQARRDERPLQSDSSSETSDPYKDIPPRPSSDNNPPLKFNRAFSLRRARLGCDEPVVTNDKKKSIRPSSAGASTSTRNRTPLGVTKSYQSVDNPSGLVKSPSKSSLARKDSSKKSNHRSNSTLTSKDVDFQNWKRRKNYDPMKAAAEGRKKQVDKKKVGGQPLLSQATEDGSSSPVGGSLLRSASFHGTDGAITSVKWNQKHNLSMQQSQYTSEDDGPYSYEEDLGPHPSPRHASPLHRSPTSPHQLCPSPVRQKNSPLIRARRPSLGLSDENEAQYKISPRKISIDESGSEGKRSPLHQGTRPLANCSVVVARPKTKMEALDNLVISTIHSLSSKVRSTSESLLQKLKSHYNEEGDRAALLEEVLSHLSENDQSAGQTRSTSRELAGILRNLKKIENALGVIDRVIIVGDDDEDLLDEVPQDWVESDY